MLVKTASVRSEDSDTTTPTGNKSTSNLSLVHSVSQPTSIRNKVLTRKRKRTKHPLRELRIRSSFTLEELADVTKLSPSYLSRLESGSRRLNADIIQRLSMALGCTPAELLPYASGSAGAASSIRTSSALASTPYPIDLPVYTVSGTASSHGTIDTTKTEQWISRPADFIGISNAFACNIQDSSWSPRYQSGENLLIHPSAPLKSGHSTIVIKADGTVYLGLLEEMQGNEITLTTSFASNDNERSKKISFNIDDLQAAYRITGTVEAI